MSLPLVLLTALGAGFWVVRQHQASLAPPGPQTLLAGVPYRVALILPETAAAGLLVLRDATLATLVPLGATNVRFASLTPTRLGVTFDVTPKLSTPITVGSAFWVTGATVESVFRLDGRPFAAA